ncbi:hypothetical protein ACEPPN_000469 [Leptodophora sp. 'Broadleaf-Isolate-01']
MKQGSKRHLIKRKDVKKLGAKLFWRGLRSLATHSLLTVCTKWALLTDKENFIRIGKVTLDLQALMDSWDSTRTVIDGLLAMDFMVDTWGQMTDMSPGSLTSQNAADWDQIELQTDHYLKTWRYQPKVIVDSIKGHQMLLDGIPNAEVLDPKFSGSGESRSTSNLIAPGDSEVETTWTADGHLVSKKDHDIGFDPLSCTVANPQPVPPPPDPPAPPTDPSKSSS